MKPGATVAVDEMFPDGGGGPYMDLDEAGGTAGLLMDLAANEKSVHADFFNDFEDIFDDEDLAWKDQERKRDNRWSWRQLKPTFFNITNDVFGARGT